MPNTKERSHLYQCLVNFDFSTSFNIFFSYLIVLIKHNIIILNFIQTCRAKNVLTRRWSLNSPNMLWRVRNWPVLGKSSILKNERTQQPNEYTRLFSAPSEAPPYILIHVRYQGNNTYTFPSPCPVIGCNLHTCCCLAGLVVAWSEPLALFPHFQSQGCAQTPDFFFQRVLNGQLADREEILAEFDQKCIVCKSI